MKKVKVKTKQKQKQKQTQIVNVNLGNILKKSQPKRKSQPKTKQFYSAQSSGGPSISFNAPPIREYVDTSLNNRPSTLETPLLLKNTTNQQSTELGFPIQNNNPLLNQPPQQKSIAYNLGQYLLQSNIPDSQMQQNMLYIKQGYENQKISNIEEENKKNKIQSNFKKQQEAIMSQIPDDMKKAKQRNELKKAETIRRNELLKAEKKKLNEEKILQKKREKELQKEKNDSSQTNMLNYVTKPSVTIKKDIQNYSVKPEETQSITSAPQEPQTIFSSPPQQESITSSPIFYQMQTESNLPTEQYVPNMSPQEELSRNRKITSAPQEPQTITSEQPPPINLFSELPQQESITSSLPYNDEYNDEPIMTKKELALNRKINKAPRKKQPPSEEDKKIKTRPIKIDPDTGQPIKKPKKQNLDKSIILPPP